MPKATRQHQKMNSAQRARYALRRYKRIWQRQDDMTTEVIGLFNRILAAYEQNTALPTAAFADITAGIAETLRIKIDSLNEARQAFSQEISTLLACSPNMAGLQKKLAQFKKEQLLFECSTFEEILHYSVSRLREVSESDAPEVHAFVAAIDENAARLSSILTCRGITLMQPSPHDMFNGREHEVLMAEEREGFAKGEIIKFINSGYKEKDIVLIRANVIAAK